MTNVSIRSRLGSATSHFAVAAMLATAGPAWAQDVPPAPADAQATATVPEAADANDDSGSPTPTVDDKSGIVITGFRASLQNAVNKKKKAEQEGKLATEEDRQALRASLRKLAGYDKSL